MLRMLPTSAVKMLRTWQFGFRAKSSGARGLDLDEHGLSLFQGIRGDARLGHDVDGLFALGQGGARINAWVQVEPNHTSVKTGFTRAMLSHSSSENRVGVSMHGLCRTTDWPVHD